MKLLALCDSPTLTTGFSRVAQNLFKAWAKRGVEVDVWAIGFAGWNYKSVPYVKTLFPAGDGGQFQQPDRLEMFLRQLMGGGYTHVFLIRPSVHGWNPTLLDHHPYKGVWLGGH